MAKSTNFRSIFLVGSRLRNNRSENLEIKKVSNAKFVFGPKTGVKLTCSKLFGSKFFGSESIMNVSKRILKQKSQNQNLFVLKAYTV